MVKRSVLLLGVTLAAVTGLGHAPASAQGKIVTFAGWGGVTQEAVEKSVEHVDGHVSRQRQRKQSRARFRPHGCQVAQIHGEGPLADGVRRHEGLIEVDAVHQRVGGEHFSTSSGRLYDGGVVAGTNLDPGRNLEAAEDPRDERVFAEFSDCETGRGIGSGHERTVGRNSRSELPGRGRPLTPTARYCRAPRAVCGVRKCSRFAVWGGRMNQLKQVEPL